MSQLEQKHRTCRKPGISTTARMVSALSLEVADWLKVKRLFSRLGYGTTWNRAPWKGGIRFHRRQSMLWVRNQHTVQSLSQPEYTTQNVKGGSEGYLTLCVVAVIFPLWMVGLLVLIIGIMLLIVIWLLIIRALMLIIAWLLVIWILLTIVWLVIWRCSSTLAKTEINNLSEFTGLFTVVKPTEWLL